MQEFEPIEPGVFAIPAGILKSGVVVKLKATFLSVNDQTKIWLGLKSSDRSYRTPLGPEFAALCLAEGLPII